MKSFMPITSRILSIKEGLSQNVYACKTVGVDPQIDPPKNAECCKTAGR